MIAFERDWGDAMRIALFVLAGAMTLIGCSSTPVARGDNAAIRAQLEKAVIHSEGYPRLYYKVQYPDMWAEMRMLTGPQFEPDRVCGSTMAVQTGIAAGWRLIQGSTFCEEYKFIVAVRPSAQSPGESTAKALDPIAGPIVCVLLLPLCIISKGTPSGG